MNEEKIQFKSIKKKNLRQRRRSKSVSDEEESKDVGEEVKLEVIHETKEKQKLRNRS